MSGDCHSRPGSGSGWQPALAELQGEAPSSWAGHFVVRVLPRGRRLTSDVDLASRPRIAARRRRTFASRSHSRSTRGGGRECRDSRAVKSDLASVLAALRERPTPPPPPPHPPPPPFPPPPPLLACSRLELRERVSGAATPGLSPPGALAAPACLATTL